MTMTMDSEVLERLLRDERELQKAQCVVDITLESMSVLHTSGGDLTVISEVPVETALRALYPDEYECWLEGQKAKMSGGQDGDGRACQGAGSGAPGCAGMEKGGRR